MITTVAGYDPGGNGKHGVAKLQLEDGVPVGVERATVGTAQEAYGWIAGGSMPVGVGIDTLTALSTGPSGWRPADRRLRKNHPKASRSIVSPNSLHGAMALNGISVARLLRDVRSEIVLSETHPKVLYYRLSGQLYDYKSNAEAMDNFLAESLGVPVTTASDHEWDAVVSCYAVYEGLAGRWGMDLHTLPPADGELIVWPTGETKYFWPSSDQNAA